MRLPILRRSLAREHGPLATRRQACGRKYQTVTPDQAPVGVPATSFLASSIIGQTVYSAANENIGEINDLVMDKENGAVTAIVGVGGFLGHGRKNVAMPMDKLTATKFEDNTLKLVINATREELEAAPAFDPAQISMNTGGQNPRFPQRPPQRRTPRRCGIVSSLARKTKQN